MAVYTLKRHPSFFKVCLLSLLIHLVVIRAVIFTFSLERVAQKPVFIFLGSILPQHDFGGFSLKQKPGDQSRSTSQAFPIKPHPLPPATTQVVGIEKPVFLSTVNQEHKIFLKTPFWQEEKTAVSTRDDMLEKLGIDPAAAKRVPFKLPAE